MAIFWPGGHEKGHNSGTKSRKMVPKAPKTTGTARATNGSLTKIAVPYQKRIFGPKTVNFGPKKGSLLTPDHVPATTGKSCQKKKVAFSQIINRDEPFGWCL